MATIKANAYSSLKEFLVKLASDVGAGDYFDFLSIDTNSLCPRSTQSRFPKHDITSSSVKLPAYKPNSDKLLYSVSSGEYLPVRFKDFLMDFQAAIASGQEYDSGDKWGDGFYQLERYSLRPYCHLNVKLKETFIFTSQPKDANWKVGESHNLVVVVKGGSAPYTYTWFSSADGKDYKAVANVQGNIDGATTDKLVISGITAANAAYYECIVTDADGNDITSTPVKITVS